jgi:hypothetical protein
MDAHSRKVKEEVIRREKGICIVSLRMTGHRVPGTDAAHVFVTRAMLPGTNITYDPHNLVLTTGDVNQKWYLPMRLCAALYLVERYTLPTIQEWVDSLNMRVPFNAERWINNLKDKTKWTSQT